MDDPTAMPERNPAIEWLTNQLRRRWPSLSAALPDLDRDLRAIVEGPAEATFVVHELRVEGAAEALLQLAEVLRQALEEGGAAAPRLAVRATPAEKRGTWQWLDLRIDPDPDGESGLHLAEAEPVPADLRSGIRSRMARRGRRGPLKLRMHRFEIILAIGILWFLVRVLIRLLRWWATGA